MSLQPGTPAPWFYAPSPVNPRFAFASLGGRYIVLAFLPAPGPNRDAALDLIRERRDQFSGTARSFFGILPDAESFAVASNSTLFRWFSDTDGALRRLYRAATPDGDVAPQWVVVDPSMRILRAAPLEQGRELLDDVIRRGDPAHHAGTRMHAPVLIVPRVLEAALCRRLIEVYNAEGGSPSGVMRERDGRTIGVLDDFKKRRDTLIEDEELRAVLRTRVIHRLLPEINKAFQFQATYIERYIVACYDAGEGGYFRAHRDNTTAGTAHRKFAVSINLNAEDFEGGDLRFAEFGPQTYRPPTGGAVVFSCSLLHEATPVTRGTRYAFLPFLYDEAGQKVREANLHLLDVGQAAEPSAAETQSSEQHGA